MDNSALSDRMKGYEFVTRQYLTRRMPVIIRVDGKAFHTLTRGCERPFDSHLAQIMDETAQALIAKVQNVRCAYVQSDEISLLLIDYNTLNTQQWFDGNIQKMVSLSAAIASVTFTKLWSAEGLFDSRVFVLPKEEVCNYFLWRQLDATRNSINMVAQSLYSHRELQEVNIKKAQELIFQRGINWNDYEAYWKRGRMVTKEGVDRNIPIFTDDREYVEKFMVIEEQ